MPHEPEERDERGVADALRDAIERTLQATAPAAAQTRDRAGGLLDEVTRRGQEARAELARRGQEAREGLARRGQEAGIDLARRLESLDARLAAIEELLRGRGEQKAPDARAQPETKPEAEG